MLAWVMGRDGGLHLGCPPLGLCLRLPIRWLGSGVNSSTCLHMSLPINLICHSVQSITLISTRDFALDLFDTSRAPYHHPMGGSAGR